MKLISDAGTGALDLVMEGPSDEPKMRCKDNYDGTMSVEYVPTEIGEHIIEIKYGLEHINGSPFIIESI